MDVFLSGAACRAVFRDGAETYFIDIDRPEERIHYRSDRSPVAAINRLLGDSPDMRRVSVVSVEDGLQTLLSDCNKDSALRLFQLVADFEDDLQLAIDAAGALEPLLKEEETFEFLRNYSFAIPINLRVAITPPPDSFRCYRICFDLLTQVVSAQLQIGNIRNSWNTVSEKHFASCPAALQAEKLFVECGGFWRICQSMIGKISRDDLMMNLLVAGASVGEIRKLVKSWIDVLGLEPDPRDQRPSVDFQFLAGLDGEAESNAGRVYASVETDREKFVRVTNEKVAVVKRIRYQELDKARRFAHEMVSRQVDEGDAAFAAKTLCSLAQEAKRLGVPTLHLEWSLLATETYSDDPWSFAQAGDALVSQYRYAEAIGYFDLAGEKGDLHYALMGRARIMMLSGQPEEALRKFEDIVGEYPEHENTYQAWIAIAKTLRHVGRLQEALQKFEQVIARFPDLDEAYAGKAKVLRELGRLDEAESMYIDFQETHGSAIWPFLGTGEVLQDGGKFEEAIKAYEVALKHFPGAEAVLLGRAHAMRAAGHLEEALAEFEEAASRDESSARAYGGLAQTLRDIGRLENGLAVYKQAIERFPSVPFLLNGRASVYSGMGRLEEALRAYDENCYQFPNNLPALLGRAQLLKEFERLDLAFDAARDLMERYPGDLRAINLMAGILALQGKYDEAVEILPIQTPRTRSEWVAHHIKCMIELRRGNMDSAVSNLEFGVVSVPFYKIRRYYKNALAVAALRRGHYSQALEAASGGDGAAAELLMAQAAAGMGNTKSAVISLNKLKDDPRENVVDLAEEIGRRHRIVAKPPKHNQLWITNRSTEIVLALAA